MFCRSRDFIMGAFFENTQKPDTSKHSAAKMFTKNSQNEPDVLAVSVSYLWRDFYYEEPRSLIICFHLGETVCGIPV